MKNGKIMVEMLVKLITHMGSDLSVVNSARVSFDKVHETFDTDKDTRLIKYLARHGHWSPFAHGSMQFRIKAPIFVARQLVKHQVGLAWNEISRRYVDTEPEFYVPDTWRAKADNKKQGSSDEEIDINPEYDSGRRMLDPYQIRLSSIVKTYKHLLKLGVCPEQARMILPMSMMTEWYWSGSLFAFSRVCNQRCKADAQKETQEIARGIDKHARELFPASWAELRKE